MDLPMQSRGAAAVVVDVDVLAENLEAGICILSKSEKQILV